MIVPLALAALALLQEPPERDLVELLRVPGGGIQPQAAVDEGGALHLLWFDGDPAAGDLWYARRDPDAKELGERVRVNRTDGAAVASGNIRGAHLALGREGRVHVAWNGSRLARPRARDGAGPMLYTRSDGRGGFERERNLIREQVGLDGGGSLAADAAGNVWVVWHAPVEEGGGEANRTVWVAHSGDDGKSFAAEEAAVPPERGACGCCGLRAGADGQGGLLVLYRTAFEGKNRDMVLLARERGAERYASTPIDRWTVSQCVMSSAALTLAPEGIALAWETRGQVRWARIDPGRAGELVPVDAPGLRSARKHPALAVNADGDVCLAWTEGMSWGQAGRVAWQVWDAGGRRVEAGGGSAAGVPTWSLVAVVPRADGGFEVVY